MIFGISFDFLDQVFFFGVEMDGMFENFLRRMRSFLDLVSYQDNQITLNSPASECYASSSWCLGDYCCALKPNVDYGSTIITFSCLVVDLQCSCVLCNAHGFPTYHLNRDLGNSNLSGHLVPELGKLEHLQYLELYRNNIQGSIPYDLGKLKDLISLDLYNNNISGKIPVSLGNLKSLVFLRLNDNKLSGPIPKTLAAVSSLKVVDVSNNNLCGPIPTTGSFEHIPLHNFENNPRLEGPELQGLASYDTNCS